MMLDVKTYFSDWLPERRRITKQHGKFLWYTTYNPVNIIIPELIFCFLEFFVLHTHLNRLHG